MREEMSEDEESAHLDGFIITTLCFLRVQADKTDLRKQRQER